MGLEEWKAKSIFTVELPSGVVVKGRYVDMELILVSGQFDYGVLSELEKVKTNGDGPTVAPAAVTEGLRYKRAVVCACLLEVDGEAVSLTEDDYASLPAEDRDAFYAFANRTVEVPLAEV